MKRALLFVLAVVIYSASIAQISPVYTNAFQHVLDSVCKKIKIKGVSVAVYRPGEGVWTSTYGESHAGVPLTTDMIFPIGSNTKTFVAAAILKLQENSQISLDDTVGKWITHTHVPGQITIKQMLNHTSGLANYTDHPGFSPALNADYNKIWQPEDMYQFIDTPNSLPGAKWEYSNTNYLLAGIIISKITSKPLEQALRDLILTPANLTKTYLYPQEQPNGIIPHGWSTLNGPKLLDMYEEFGYTNTAFLSMATGAGAYVSTAEDNVKFWHALMSGQIVNTNSLILLKEFIDLGNNQGYGLGVMKFMTNGRKVYSHGGTCFAFINENLYDSTGGVYITALSNQDSIYNSQLQTRVVAALHKLTLKMPALGMNNVNTADISMKLYPNPATEILHAYANGISRNASIEIVDMTGRMVHAQTIHEGDNLITLDGFAPGLYLAKVHDNGLIQTQKIQVVK